MRRTSDFGGSTTSESEPTRPVYDGRAIKVHVTSTTLAVDLADGRQIRVSLRWFPLLREASDAERNEYRIDDSGKFIHWPRVDEDIEVEHLLWVSQG